MELNDQINDLEWFHMKALPASLSFEAYKMKSRQRDPPRLFVR